ncbi:PAS domain S-box protein [Methanosarcina sp. KYL-1]|uniref:PAS domain-containing sensor histidine kinase n=1 Tax=Methanosarcina sp. KYL-1 TaxID=2602068 RepID=UPI0021018232
MREVFAREHGLQKSENGNLTIDELCNCPVFKQFQIGMAIVGTDGKWLKVNSALCRILGYSNAELLELDFQSLTHPDDLNPNLRIFNEILNNPQGVYQTEKRYIRKDGVPIWARVSTFLFRDHEYRPLYFISQIVDIDEQKKSVLALKESREKLKTIFENADEGIIISEPGGCFLEVNAKVCDILGYTPDELLQMKSENLISPQSAEQFSTATRELRQKNHATFESIITGKDGKLIPTEVKMRFIDYGGKEAVLTLILDVTERKQAERDLQNQVQFLKTLLNAIPAPVYYKNREGKYQGCNERFASEIIGLPEEYIVGHTVDELSCSIPKRMAALYKKKDLELFEAGGTQLYEGKILCVGKKIRDFSFSKTTYGTVSGEVQGIIGVMLDITERKKVEKDLKTKNTAVESSINAIAMADLKGRLTYVNPSFLMLWGYEDKQELLGNSCKFLWENHRKASAGFWRLYSEGAWEGNLVARKKNNALFDVHISANLLFNENGHKIGMMGSFIDVTQKRKAQAALLEAKLNAEASNRAKSEFLATMSHELRTPLNAVIGFSDILLSQNFGQLNEKQLRYTGNILKSGKHLLKLINDILDLSKVESGMTELNLEEFSLVNAIDEVRTMLMPRSSQKNIRIVTLISSGKTNVVADKTRFNQILYNLVGNALKFTPDGSMITISIQASEDKFQISVADQGKGILQAEYQRIFQPFVQLEKFESREQAGAGLGLALVKRFVEMHGGEIWVDSEVGKGSAFTFTLPKNQEKEREEQH